MSTLKEQWAVKWQALIPQTRTNLVRFAVVSVVGLFVFGAYYASGQKEKNAAPKKAAEMHPIKLGDQLLEDDVRSSISQDRSVQNTINQQVTKQLKEVGDQQTKVVSQLDSFKNLIEDLKSSVLPDDPIDKSVKNPKKPDGRPKGVGLQEVEGQFKYPPPPANGGGEMQNVNFTQARASGPVGPPDAPPHVEFIGSIGHGVGESDPLSKKPEAKKKRSVLLPPGFMSARLLTGVRARTVSQARENPQQLMFRVQEPAVLPNSVKADLQGCFVLGNVTAALDTERIEVRLANLSCIAQNGHSAIDQEVHGYVSDESDGQAGLAAIPVTKAGANLMRAFIVGGLGGLGEIIKSGSQTQSLSPLGSTTSLDPTKVNKAIAGGALVEGANDLKKIFIDLIKQSAPILETGPGKEVTVVITEGVNIDIKEYDVDEE